jgi:hypothetical protein
MSRCASVHTSDGTVLLPPSPPLSGSFELPGAPVNSKRVCDSALLDPSLWDRPASAAAATSVVYKVEDDAGMFDDWLHPEDILLTRDAYTEDFSRYLQLPPAESSDTALAPLLAYPSFLSLSATNGALVDPVELNDSLASPLDFAYESSSPYETVCPSEFSPISPGLFDTEMLSPEGGWEGTLFPGGDETGSTSTSAASPIYESTGEQTVEEKEQEEQEEDTGRQTRRTTRQSSRKRQHSPSQSVDPPKKRGSYTRPSSYVPRLHSSAPIQTRRYIIPSSTSRKALPIAVSRTAPTRRLLDLPPSSQGSNRFSIDENSPEALELPAEVIATVEKKREQNTRAARLSRERKANYVKELEQRDEQQRAVIDDLMEEVARLKGLLEG